MWKKLPFWSLFSLTINLYPSVSDFHTLGESDLPFIQPPQFYILLRSEKVYLQGLYVSVQIQLGNTSHLSVMNSICHLLDQIHHLLQSSITTFTAHDTTNCAVICKLYFVS